MDEHLTALRLEIDGLDIEYGDVGDGAPVVFVHGAYVTGAVWTDVVSRLSVSHRCVTPTWLFGAQRQPSPAGTDFGVPASAARIGALLDELDLDDVTLVANDTGGGIVLSALADPPPGFHRISRLIFTNCDSFEKFPPPNFAPIIRLCRASAAAGSAALRLLATPLGLSVFASAVTVDGIAPARRGAIFGGFVADRRVRREAVAFSAGLQSSHIMAAVEGLRTWRTPVLAVWGESDGVLTVDDAKRLVATAADGRLVTIPAASTFVMLDRPAKVAEVIAKFAAR